MSRSRPIGAAIRGTSAKKSAPSSAVIASTSATDLPLNMIASVSALNRLPPQTSQSTCTFGRKFISTLSRPCPWHFSQRPPLTLNEKRDAV